MIRTWFVSLIVLVEFLGLARADESAMPRGPAPQFMAVTKISGDGIRLEERLPGREKAECYRERVYELGFADVQVLDAAGKPLTQEGFRKRIAAQPVVLVFAEKVEPAYCRVVRNETVVLVVRRGKLEPTIESELIKTKVVPEASPPKPPRR